LIIDSLYSYTKPLEYRIELQKSDSTPLFSVPEAFDISYSCSLKEINTFDFKIPYLLNGEPNDHIDSFLTDYMVYVKLWSIETETYFMEERFKIVSVENTSTEDGVYTKQISCKALEIELGSKIVKNLKGSKVLYRTPSEISSFSASSTYPTLSDFINSGILNIITSLSPSWTVDTIDLEIAALYRYFDISSESSLNFLLNECATSYMCIFFFDTIEKKISVRNLTHLGTDRGLLLSQSNYIKSHTETVDSDSVVTRLYITGNEEISIRSVNPTGESYILDLSYYRNDKYMSQSLLDALDSYDLLISLKETEFATLLSSLNTYTSTLTSQKSQLTILQAQLKVLEIALDELKEEGASLVAKSAEISAKSLEITTKESEIAATTANITTTNNSIEALQTEILIANNFTNQQIFELDKFVKDKETNDTSILTSSELYDEGKKIIATLNQPSINFDIDIVDIYSIIDDPSRWDKISLGDIASIKIDSFKTDIQLRILGFVHNFNSNSLKLNFANKANLNDLSMLQQQIKNNTSVTTSLDIQKYKTLTKDSSEYSAIESSVYGELDLSTRTAKAGNNQGISINEHGIVCTNAAYPQEIMQLLNSGFYLTNDGWQTAKVAIDANGVNAEVVRGVLGEFASLKAEQIQLNDDGSGLSEVGIKVSHVDGSYTSMESDGFQRYTPIPTYSESPTGVPNVENFTGKTIAGLQIEGWEFGGLYGMGTNELLVGHLTSVTESYARVTKYITKENSSFTFTYRNYVDSENDADYYFYIDNARYKLTSSSTNISFPSSGTITLSEGWHIFQWHCTYSMSVSAPSSPNDLYMYIDNIVFEQNPYAKTITGTDVVGSTYNYMVTAGSGTTQLGGTSGKLASRYESSIPYTLVQLPDEWKGKNFKVNVFLQDTGDGAYSDSLAMVKIKVVEDSIDYANARFKVKAVTSRRAYGVYDYGSGITGFYTIHYYQGCDFTFVVTC
jgi:hypothetical protein